MHVLFATAELAPLVRVGGLGEVSGGVTRELRRLGVDVDVALPDYFATPLGNETIIPLDVPEWVGPATARHGELADFGPVTLIGVTDIQRAGPYGDPGQPGYWDNDRRFFRFSAAVAALARLTSPDVIHVNDWHTGATLAFTPPELPSVASIHNLAYQGISDYGWLQVFGERSGAYDHFGNCNPLHGCLVLADRIIAVSPTYANEITQPENGCGLDGLLAGRGADLVGIINGIDTIEWNPAADPVIAAPFSVDDLRGKARCRADLRAQMGLGHATGPLVGFVSRLVEQKGVDFLIEAAEFLESIDAQLVIVGNGEKAFVDALRAAAVRQPERIVFREAFDLTMSHRVFAGSDLFAMPSRFEPCGLAQMQAMRYGTLPVVTGVGGLVDTVIDLTRFPTTGTGFVSSSVSAAGMVDAFHRAAMVFGARERFALAQRRAMQIDWSWRGPAQQYLDLYLDLYRGPSGLSVN
jgi:starch synthase